VFIRVNSWLSSFGGHLTQIQKEQHGTGNVKGQIRQVMHGSIQPEELHHEHVREPGKRMPVAGCVSSKGPDGVPPSQALLHPGIASEIFGIIIKDELVTHHWPKGDEGGRGEERADQNRALCFVHHWTEGTGLAGLNMKKNSDQPRQFYRKKRR
jgi:hypothetical protein